METLMKWVDEYGAKIKPFICDTGRLLREAQKNGKNIMFEAQLGSLRDLDFGWRIVKHVKSNAIAVVRDGHTLGIGAGQMNRVGSAEIALKEAQAAGFTEGLILASDGFLPFGDTVALAAQYGVAAIIQPGGSIRDEESIQKADELGITMLFTGVRHFKH